MPNDELRLLLTATHFAADKHRTQRRKDEEASPYINHPIAVAQTLVELGAVEDLTTIVAALLHDTVEDTETTLEELSERFGAEVAAVVAEVSDDKSLPSAERKRRQVEHAPVLSQRAKLVKLADKICNVSDVLSAPPASWSAARKAEYLRWAGEVVAGVRGVNPALEARFDELVGSG
jgi:guanosine-3',5'-bis(diphosphate) 3'-pyrophosphohydrolase